jgi:hypothetical protein
VRATAFMPNPRDGTTSVCCIDGLGDAEIWRTADEWLLGTKARGDFSSSVVVGEAGLILDVDNTPLHHASIRGWPDQKDAQMNLAQVLAAGATLMVRGPSRV